MNDPNEERIDAFLKDFNKNIQKFPAPDDQAFIIAFIVAHFLRNNEEFESSLASFSQWVRQLKIEMDAQKANCCCCSPKIITLPKENHV